VEKLIFKEIQKFKQKWIWMLLILTNGIWIWGIVQQVVFMKPFGNNPISNMGLFIIAILMILFSIGFYNIKMITEIRKGGVYYRFSVFQFKFKKIDMHDIRSYEIKNYNSLKEFGGWGIRMQNRKNIAYNVSGNMGIQFELKNGKKILIGTQLPNGFKKALDKLAG